MSLICVSRGLPYKGSTGGPAKALYMTGRYEPREHTVKLVSKLMERVSFY